ncbi:MAG: hypothetical protein K5694_02610 [Bacilli bacterium]|nr:hypothetical protein [Bacilli bacterium]
MKKFVRNCFLIGLIPLLGGCKILSNGLVDIDTAKGRLKSIMASASEDPFLTARSITLKTEVIDYDGYKETSYNLDEHIFDYQAAPYEIIHLHNVSDDKEADSYKQVESNLITKDENDAYLIDGAAYDPALHSYLSNFFSFVDYTKSSNLYYLNPTSEYLNSVPTATAVDPNKVYNNLTGYSLSSSGGDQLDVYLESNDLSLYYDLFAEFEVTPDCTLISTRGNISANRLNYSIGEFLHKKNGDSKTIYRVTLVFGYNQQ